jgi:hypothetical protein
LVDLAGQLVFDFMNERCSCEPDCSCWHPPWFSTYQFQQRTAQRAEATARQERLRQDRLTACSGFAAAVTDLRRAVIAVWFRERWKDRTFADQDSAPGDKDSALADYRAAYAEADRLGAVALGAKFRMPLLLDDPGLRELADVAFGQIDDLRSATDKAEVEALDVKFESHMSTFVATSAQLLV